MAFLRVSLILTLGMHMVLAGPPVCPRVCIFDIDNTVAVGAECQILRHQVIPNPPPAWPNHSGTTHVAKKVIKKCHALGYAIAFASAESFEEQRNAAQFKFITALEPEPGMFNKSFFDSPAFQSSWNVLAHTAEMKKLEYSHKDGMLMQIMQYYGVIPSCFNESIMFDDQVENIYTAHKLGMRSVQASPECGGVYCDQGCGLSRDALHVFDTHARQTSESLESMLV